MAGEARCPECAQGKTQNCAGQALDANDEFVPCAGVPHALLGVADTTVEQRIAAIVEDCEACGG